MHLSQGNKAIVFTLFGFAAYLLLGDYFAPIKAYLDKLTHDGLTSYMLTNFIIGIPVYLATYLIKPRINIFKNLGMQHNPLKPFLMACVFSIPMFLGGMVFFEFNRGISIPNIVAGTIVIGFVEELFYRGFLFGQLYKYTELGFISAIFLGAIVFATGHLYQSQDTLELIGIFAVTFMGAVLFAWLYVEWNYNLWVPVFLHALMNLAWHLFNMDQTALGGVLPNIFRGLTIVLAIVFTIIYKKKRKQKLVITIDKLILKKTG